jgi:hypothetical protein
VKLGQEPIRKIGSKRVRHERRERKRHVKREWLTVGKHAPRLLEVSLQRIPPFNSGIREPGAAYQRRAYDRGGSEASRPSIPGGHGRDEDGDQHHNRVLSSEETQPAEQACEAT